MLLRCKVMLVSYFFKKVIWTLKEIRQWKKLDLKLKLQWHSIRFSDGYYYVCRSKPPVRGNSTKFVIQDTCLSKTAFNSQQTF